jgi:hypothetical protein
MTTKELSEEIFKRYGAVTRARGYFLYTKKGVRLTDMFLEGGRAILGWHTGTAFTQMKNILSRGLTGSFRTEERSRLEKAVSELLKKEVKVFCFADKKSALTASVSISKDNSAIWKPFNKEIDYSAADSLILCPPLSWTNSIFLLAADTNKELPGEIKLPFALETAVTRAIYDYIAEEKIREEKDWFIYDTFLNQYFTRKGCCLTPKVPREKYDEFVLYCLDNHLIINPHFEGESFVPYKVDKGNFSAIKNSPFKF